MLSVCTMWDDGLVSDLPLIEELDRRGIIASFALSPLRYGASHVANDQRGNYGTLVSLGETQHYQPHDIVSHTLTHEDLRTLSPDAVAEQLVISKSVLEQWFAKPVPGLCYPYGQPPAGRAAAQHYRCARGLHPQSKLAALLPTDWSQRYDLKPTAHWTVPDLADKLLSSGLDRALIWGHTYEFGTDMAGLPQAIRLYEALQAGGARFVTFEEAVYGPVDGPGAVSF